MDKIKSEGNLLDETLDSKKDFVQQRLLQRESERLAAVERKKTEKEANSLDSEQVSYFWITFKDAKTRILQDLDLSKKLSKNELVDHFDKITEDIQKLQKYLFDSSIFLPSYDKRSSQEALKLLLQALNDQQDELLPKQKFGFKIRKKEGCKPSENAITSTDEIDNRMSSYASTLGFKNEKNEDLYMATEKFVDKDVSLSNLTNCKVKLFGYPNTIHMNSLKDCQIFTGPVKTSIFIEECTSCTFVVACQQLRVHKTRESDFYLHVVSKAIIEDCSDLHFAPYNLQYQGLDEHYSKSTLNRETNHWDEVNDFYWLATDQVSPNWSVLPEKDRVTEWNV